LIYKDAHIRNRDNGNERRNLAEADSEEGTTYTGRVTTSTKQIDMLQVLNDESMPVTFKEKQELYLKVSSLTRPVAKQIPIDLMVFTLPMFEQFKLANTNFSEEILTKGIVIYESEHQTMA